MAKKRSLSKKEVSAIALGSSLLDAQLVKLRMQSTTAEVTCFREKPPSQLTQQVEIGGGADLESNRLMFDINISLKGGDKIKKTHSILVKASYQMVLKVPDGTALDEKVHEEIGKRTGLNLVWPYWRELVTSMTSRMGLAPLVIPILDQDSLWLVTEDNKKTSQKSPKRKTVRKPRKKK